MRQWFGPMDSGKVYDSCRRIRIRDRPNKRWLHWSGIEPSLDSERCLWRRRRANLLAPRANSSSALADSPESRWSTCAVSYTHLRAHETPEHLVCRLLLEKKKK